MTLGGRHGELNIDISRAGSTTSSDCSLGERSASMSSTHSHWPAPRRRKPGVIARQLYGRLAPPISREKSNLNRCGASEGAVRWSMPATPKIAGPLTTVHALRGDRLFHPERGDTISADPSCCPAACLNPSAYRLPRECCDSVTRRSIRASLAVLTKTDRIYLLRRDGVRRFNTARAVGTTALRGTLPFLFVLNLGFPPPAWTFPRRLRRRRAVTMNRR